MIALGGPLVGATGTGGREGISSAQQRCQRRIGGVVVVVGGEDSAGACFFVGQREKYRGFFRWSPAGPGLVSSEPIPALWVARGSEGARAGKR